MDIAIDLDRTEYVKQRISLMKTLQAPTLSDAKNVLGFSLAQVVFDQCDPTLRFDFGLTPLKGTRDELWVSPSDLLIQKVALKPPLTQKHIQALTHEGILRIGGEIEKKFLNEIQMREENFFETRKKHLVEQFEEQVRVEARCVEQRERQSFQNHTQKMIDEFHKILLEELDKLEEKLKRKQGDVLKNQKALLSVEWDKKLNEEVEKTVKNMTAHFIDEVDKQKTILTSNFKLELHKVHVQKSFDVGMEQAKAEESLKQLKHNLECKNIANMMYLLCVERRKCCYEKDRIIKGFTNEIKELNMTISDRDRRIKTLIKERNKHVKEVKLREKCLLEIIRQFQKFINFALRAAPTQAEFLLSIEKMMVFELTNTLLKTNYALMKPCQQILRWQFQETPSEKEQDTGLEIQDHHNCLKETLRTDEDSAGSPDYLPAFTYKDKLYVREDFRNMISQGIEITRSNELWSKDVEILIGELRKSVSKTESEAEEESVVKETEHLSIMAQSKSKESKNLTHSSSIQFKFDDRVPEREKRVSVVEQWSSAARKSSLLDRKVSLKPCLSSMHTINFAKIGKVEQKPALIATTNSLDLIIKRGSVKYLKDETGRIKTFDDEYDLEEDIPYVPPEPNFKLDEMVKLESELSLRLIPKKSTNSSLDTRILKAGSKQSSKRSSPKQSFRDSLVLDVRDSIIMQKASLLKKSTTEFTVEPHDSIDLHLESRSDFRRKASKLVTAKNSLEILRESKHKITEFAAPIFAKKESPRSKPITTCNKMKCNDKCSQTKDILDVLEDFNEDEKRARRESTEKSIKMSHIEIIRLLNDSKDTNVSINVKPVVYETGDSTYSLDLTETYKDEKPKKTKKKKLSVKKDKLLNLPNTTKIVGDSNAQEHRQTTEEFTEERVHSLLELIKDNPTLMRTFTACSR